MAAKSRAQAEKRGAEKSKQVVFEFLRHALEIRKLLFKDGEKGDKYEDTSRKFGKNSDAYQSHQGFLRPNDTGFINPRRLFVKTMAVVHLTDMDCMSSTGVMLFEAVVVYAVESINAEAKKIGQSYEFVEIEEAVYGHFEMHLTLTVGQVIGGRCSAQMTIQAVVQKLLGRSHRLKECWLKSMSLGGDFNRTLGVL